MDAATISAAGLALAGVIGAVGVLIRQTRVNGREQRQEMAVNEQRVRLHQRITEAAADLNHELRYALSQGGRPVPDAAALIEARIERLRAQLAALDNDTTTETEGGR